MTTFSEANVNAYLNSISTNLIALQSFANDIESNFVNCFQTRFIMTPVDITNMNSWPSLLKDQIALATRFTVDYFATDTTMELDFVIEGFEAPPLSSESVTNDQVAAGGIKIKFEGYLEIDGTTGNTKYKAKAKMTWPIC